MNQTTIALGTIAALVVLIIYSINLSVIQGPAQQAENNYWTEKAKESPKNFQLICPPSEDGKPIPAEKCERSGHYQYDREQQMLDHRAQISMKRAAWVTAVFTGFGLLLIGITLGQAFKAANLASKMLTEANDASNIARYGLVEAKKATIAANESVRVNKDMGEKSLIEAQKTNRQQLTPYLLVKSIEFIFTTTFYDHSAWVHDEKVSIKIILTLQNSGSTPIFNITANGKADLGGETGEQRPIENGDPLMSGHVSMIGPSEEKPIIMNGQIRYKDFDTDAELVVLSGLIIVVMGDLSFDDIFTIGSKGEKGKRAARFMYGGGVITPNQINLITSYDPNIIEHKSSPSLG